MRSRHRDHRRAVFAPNPDHLVLTDKFNAFEIIINSQMAGICDRKQAKAWGHQ